MEMIIYCCDYRHHCKTFLVVVVLLMIFSGSRGVYVNWYLESNPAVIGNTTYLTCNISDKAHNCSQSLRQWLGGKEYGSICQNKKCQNTMKFDVMNTDSMCIYMLVIKNLSYADLNCDYTCSYGVFNMRKNLTLSDNYILYIPSGGEITHNSSKENGLITTKSLIEKIYPEPRCNGSYEGKNITNEIKLTTKQTGFFFSAEISISIQTPTCSARLLVNCFLEQKKVAIIDENIDGGDCSCTGIHLVAAIVGSISAMIMIVGLLYMYTKRKQKRRKQQKYMKDIKDQLCPSEDVQHLNDNSEKDLNNTEQFPSMDNSKPTQLLCTCAGSQEFNPLSYLARPQVADRGKPKMGMSGHSTESLTADHSG